MQVKLERNFGLDLLKCIAALMITNSHFVVLYQGHNIGYATLGVHGNALFFFISGFFLHRLMFVEQSDCLGCFSRWIKDKISRLWPTILVYPIVASLFYGKIIDWKDFLLAGDYWFVRSLLINYFILYFVVCFFRKYLISILVLFYIVFAVFVIFSNKVVGSIYHDSQFHYVCYICPMLLGVIVGIAKDRIKNNSKLFDVILFSISFLLYFGIMHLGKGKSSSYYYLQLFALLPLLSFLWYLYKLSQYKWGLLFNYNIFRHCVYFISALTLEIYLVQFDIITDKFNSIYPFNTIIVFLIILVVAFVLRVFTNFLIQTLSNDNWSWRKMLVV